jgi:TolA-binding protein
MLNRVAFAAIPAALVAAIPLTHAFAQGGPAELVVRIDRLENQIRQLTGQIEQMQYRNQQLEAALNELRSGEPGSSRGGSRLPAGPPGAAPPNQPSLPGGRRSDAFDPAENPAAPGPPRVLGAIPPQPPPGAVSPNQYGMPGGRRSDAIRRKIPTLRECLARWARFPLSRRQ